MADIAVAEFTFDLFQNGVPPVGEINILGNPVQPLPVKFPARFDMLDHDFFFLALADGFFMASGADRQTRFARRSLLFVIGMAIEAFQVILRMNLVIESEGLFNAAPGIGKNEDDPHQPDRQTEKNTPSALDKFSFFEDWQLDSHSTPMEIEQSIFMNVTSPK
jgi:hypothetical protein